MTIPSYLNGISNIQNATDNGMGFGIRDNLDLNPDNFMRQWENY